MGMFSKDKKEEGNRQDAVLDALRTVEDPDLHKDLVSLGMIKELKVEGETASFTVELTTPACPMKGKIEQDCRDAVGKVEGISDIQINMTANTAAKGGTNEAAPIPGVANVFAVSSGKGGVGKSTVAANLALALQKIGARVGLMDADAYGPNIPQMMGVTDAPTVKENRIIPPEVGGMKVVSVGLIAQGDTPVVWRGPMLHSLIQQFLHDVEWGELDYLVVDMPPGTGDAQLSLSKLTPLAGAVLVTTPQKVAQSDVKRAIQMFRKVETPVLGVVENMSYFIAPDTGQHYSIFGSGGGEQLAMEYEIPFLGRIPIDPRIAEGGDAGKPAMLEQQESTLVTEFEKIAGQVAQQISIANKLNQPLPVLQ